MRTVGDYTWAPFVAEAMCHLTGTVNISNNKCHSVSRSCNGNPIALQKVGLDRSIWSHTLWNVAQALCPQSNHSQINLLRGL